MNILESSRIPHIFTFGQITENRFDPRIDPESRL